MHGIGKRKLLCNIMKDTRFTVKKQCEKMQDCQCKSKLKKRCLPRTMTSSDVMRVSRMSDIKKLLPSRMLGWQKQPTIPINNYINN